MEIFCDRSWIHDVLQLRIWGVSPSLFSKGNYIKTIKVFGQVQERSLPGLIICRSIQVKTMQDFMFFFYTLTIRKLQILSSNTWSSKQCQGFLEQETALTFPLTYRHKNHVIIVCFQLKYLVEISRRLYNESAILIKRNSEEKSRSKNSTKSATVFQISRLTASLF